MELENKTAVVTGAARGIGACVAETFAKEGVKQLILVDLNEEQGQRTAESIRENDKCNCTFVATNIASSGDIEKVFSLVRNTFDSLDILVNCAGVCNSFSIEEIDGEEWDKVLGINLRGTYLCCREALSIMKPQKSGKIINFSSISGRIGGIATGINYATSKGGIITLTMSLAKAAGPYGINVNGVSPGFINTEMTKDFTHFDTNTVPLRRIGEPEDVADVVVFLASRKARYITGQTIEINGGTYMV